MRFPYDPLETTACCSQYSTSFIVGRALNTPPYFLFFFIFFRLSTKPGSVPSILKSHSLTAERQFLASNTVWRFRQGVRLYCLTMMKSSTEASPVSSAQVWRGPRVSSRLSGLLSFGMFPCFEASSTHTALKVQLVVVRAFPGTGTESPPPHTQ